MKNDDVVSDNHDLCVNKRVVRIVVHVDGDLYMSDRRRPGGLFRTRVDPLVHYIIDVVVFFVCHLAFLQMFNVKSRPLLNPDRITLSVPVALRASEHLVRLACLGDSRAVNHFSVCTGLGLTVRCLRGTGRSCGAGARLSRGGGGRFGTQFSELRRSFLRLLHQRCQVSIELTQSVSDGIGVDNDPRGIKTGTTLEGDNDLAVPGRNDTRNNRGSHSRGLLNSRCGSKRIGSHLRPFIFWKRAPTDTYGSMRGWSQLRRWATVTNVNPYTKI